MTPSDTKPFTELLPGDIVLYPPEPGAAHIYHSNQWLILERADIAWATGRSGNPQYQSVCYTPKPTRATISSWDEKKKMLVWAQKVDKFIVNIWTDTIILREGVEIKFDTCGVPAKT